MCAANNEFVPPLPGRPNRSYHAIFAGAVGSANCSRPPVINVSRISTGSAPAICALASDSDATPLAVDGATGTCVGAGGGGGGGGGGGVEVRVGVDGRESAWPVGTG